MTDYGDPDQVTEQKKLASLEVDRDTEELRKLLQDAAMRRFIWRLMAYCRTFNSDIVSDPILLAGQAGMKNVGMWVFREVDKADTHAFTRMRSEARERERNHA